MRYAGDDAVKALAAAFGADMGEVKPNVRKINTDANRAPLPSDDEAQGYEVGSRWLCDGQEWVRRVVSGEPRWMPVGEVTVPSFGAQPLPAPSIIAGSVELRPSAVIDGIPEDQSFPIQAAIDYTAGLGKFLEAPEGVYGVDGYKGAQAAWGAGEWAHGGLLLRPGTRIVGAGPGKSVFRNVASNWRCVMRPLPGRTSVRGITIDGNIQNFANIPLGTTSATTGSMRGEGFVTAVGGDYEVELSDAEIVNTGHYGVGLQLGKIRSGLFRDLHFRNIGGDAIDIKTYSAPDYAKQLLIENIWAYDGCGRNYAGGPGVAPHDNQTCIDIGGPAIVAGVRIYGLDSYGTQIGNVGVRVRSRVDAESRLDGRMAQISDVYVESSKLPTEGSETAKRVIGVMVNADHASVSAVKAVGCYDGVRVTAAGDSQANYATMRDITAIGCRGAAGGGAGVRLAGSAKGVTGGDFHLHDCDTGLIVDAAGAALHGIHLRGNTRGLSASDAVLRASSITGVVYEGNTENAGALTGPARRHNFDEAVQVTADRTASLDLVSTFNGSGWAGVPYVRVNAYKADTTGVPAGRIGSMEYRSTGDSGGDGTWVFTSKDTAGVFQDVFSASKDKSVSYRPHQLASYTTAQLAGLPAPGAGGTVYCPDGNDGQPALAVFTGAGWQRVALGAATLGRLPVTPEMFGAVGDGVADDAPAFRAAVAFLSGRGGGELHLGEKAYRLSSTAPVTRANIGSTAFNPAYEAQYFVALPSRVSLIGVPGKTKLVAASSGSEAVIGLLDWGNARIHGVELVGPGATGNAMHGVLFITTTLAHICENFEVSSLHVHDVGSYGIGYQYGLPRRGVVRDCIITDTGSDGVDWKVRGQSTPVTFAEGVVFDNLEVRRFGARITDGNATGYGIRGPVQASNIRVYELDASQTGIMLAPGHAHASINHYSIGADRATLTNWYVEGKRANYGENAAYGLVVWEAGSVVVGPGVARWCRVHTKPATATPYLSLHGPRVAATVIPAANDSVPVLLQVPGATIDVDVQSDHDIFSPKGGTAVAGQTVFSTPSGYGAFVKVVRERATLTAGTDYSVSGNDVTLASPLAEGETLFLVYPPVRAVRVEADYQRITGHADKWCLNAVSYAATTHEATSSHLGFVADGHPGRLSLTNSPTIIGLIAAGPGNVPLRLTGSGSGPAEVSRPKLVNVPTSSTGLASGTVWSDAGALKIVP